MFTLEGELLLDVRCAAAVVVTRFHDPWTACDDETPHTQQLPPKPRAHPPGDEPPPLSQSVLDLNGLCGPRLSHDGGSSAAAAVFLEAAQHAKLNSDLDALTAEHAAAAAAVAQAQLFAK